MDHSGRLIKQSLEAKSKISHPFDDIFLFVLNYKDYGFNPFFKEYEGKDPLDWRMSNRHVIFEEILKKLEEREPLFKNVSPKFKKDLFVSFYSEFEQFFDKDEFYENIEMVNWTLIYSDFRGLSHLKDKNYTKDDLILLRKLDIHRFKAINLVGQMCPNLYKDYRNAFRKEDPILYYKLNPNKAS